MPIRPDLLVAAAVAAIISCHSAFAMEAAAAAPSAAELAARYPKGSIESADAARKALTEVEAARAAVAERFTQEQNACYAKFFATSCMDAAKERRRAELEQLRSVEVDANYYLRKERADERDKALAQKRAEDEAQRAEHEERAAKAAAARARADAKRQAPDSGPQGTPDPDRVARHEKRLQEIQARDAAEASERAANIAAYERKVKEAQARQQEIARKKAEKEKERAGNGAPALH